MSVEVKYSKFMPKEGEDPSFIKRLMARDSSWGTYINKLEAIEKCCGQSLIDRCKTTEPQLINTNEGSHDDPNFSLIFPSDNFDLESEGIDHFISTIAGDIVKYTSLENIEVDDFVIHDNQLYENFPGPNIGIEELYNSLCSRTLKGINRPLLAFSVKPRLGLSTNDYEKIFIKAAEGGIDIVEDDERLINHKLCPFKERVDVISNLSESYDTIYSVNITGFFKNAMERLEYAYSKGIKMVKFDVLVSGFECLRQIAMHIRDSYNSKIAITVYPDAYGAYRKLSRKFILKMSKLCGADIIYAGSPNWARYESEGEEPRKSFEPVYQRHLKLSEVILNAPHIRKTLPTITNDYHPSRIEFTTAFFRKYYNNYYKYAFFIGGGISGFPDKIKIAVKEILNCIKHAITYDIDNYVGYNLDKYEEKFLNLGWKKYDIEGGLQ